MMDCPILVWMLSLNRECTREEYDVCYKLVQDTMQHVKAKYAPEQHDSLLHVVSQMMPLLMMRHRRVPRAMWRDRTTNLGKHWIEQDPAGMQPDRYLRSMIGYSLAFDTSLIGMAMVQGAQREVINVGFGMRKLAVEPADASVPAYVESLSHKLTPHELSLLGAQHDEAAVLRRLTILLALKHAYIKAIGQPLGFDWSRLEFDVPARTARGDDLALQGWEFRVFNAQLGVLRGAPPSPLQQHEGGDGAGGALVEETYVCCVAFFRGTRETKFDFHESMDQLESWVQFINIDQMLKVVPKLTA